MLRNWWIYIGLFLIIGLIIALTYQNEKTYQSGIVQKQKEQAMRDSIMRQLLWDVDSIKDGLRNIGEISNSLREGQREQLENDTLNRKELQQIGRRIQSAKKK